MIHHDINMTNHDSIRDISKDNIELSEVLKKVAPEFAELSVDIKEVAKFHNDPMFLAMLLFKLTKEREETNKLLERIDEKFDKLMLMLKTQPYYGVSPETPVKEFEVLSEQDEKIMQLTESRGQITIDDVQKALNYKAQNGASQRLNKLFKEGHLKKIKAGKKVFFISSTSKHTLNSQEQTIK